MPLKKDLTRNSQNVFRNEFRLSFAWAEDELLTEGITRVARVIRKIQKGSIKLVMSRIKSYDFVHRAHYHP